MILSALISRTIVRHNIVDETQNEFDSSPCVLALNIKNANIEAKFNIKMNKINARFCQRNLSSCFEQMAIVL